MNGKDLLLGLSYISRRYIEEAERDTVSDAMRASGGKYEQSTRQPRRLRRPLLIAALVALMLLLVGCAVIYALHMQDLQIGEHTIMQSQHGDGEHPTSVTEIQLDVLSLQGIKDSPNYQANQEWLQFTQSYTPEPCEYWESSKAYWAYSVQDQVMVDKLEEICTKYGLNVIGKPWHEHMDCNKFLKLAGVNGLLKADSTATLTIPQGRFFSGGSFTIYGTLTLPDAEMPLYLTYHYVKKDVFYDVFAYVVPGTVTERSCTTAEGDSLLLLESGQSGMIMADRADCFITLGIDLNDSVSLEHIAAQFDFTIQSTPIDTAAADAREQASLVEYSADDPYKDRFVRDSYKEYVEDLLWNEQQMRMGGFSADEIPEMEYAFHDLDGDGRQELLIFYNGSIGSVVGIKDGKTNEGKSYSMTLCENNVLIDKAGYSLGETWYHIFFFANDGDPVFSNPKEQSIVRLKKSEGVWWRTSSTDHYAEFDTQITEEEALDILNSYAPVALDTRPLSQFEEPQ